MSSRKRHLLAFALTLLLVLPPLLWLAARLSHAQAPATAGHAVPIRLSELAPTTPRTPPRQPAPARAAPPAKAADKPAPEPTKSRKNAVKKPSSPTRSTPPPKRTLKKLPKAKPRPAKPRRTPAKPPVHKASAPKPVPLKPARPASPRRNPAPQTSRHTASTEQPTKTLRQPPPATGHPAQTHPSRSAAPTPASAATAPAPPRWLGERQRYLERLRQRIARLAQDTYPYRARRLGMQGTVTLHFTLHPDGRIDRLSVLQSSGHDVLDEAARAIIEEEMDSRFDPFPAALPPQPIEVTIPIRYRLR